MRETTAVPASVANGKRCVEASGRITTAVLLCGVSGSQGVLRLRGRVVYLFLLHACVEAYYFFLDKLAMLSFECERREFSDLVLLGRFFCCFCWLSPLTPYLLFLNSSKTPTQSGDFWVNA